MTTTAHPSATPSRRYERLRPAFRLWYLWWLSRSRRVLSARDEPSARSADRTADTVLVVGNGPAHGWGVASHQDALVGQLARATTATTGRPTSVDLVGDEMMSLEATRAWIRGTDLALYDAVVVVVGLNDALRLTPLAVWERELRALVTEVEGRAHATARTVLVGIPPVRSLKAFDSPLGSVAQRHADRLDAVAREVAEEAGLTWVPLPAADRPRREHGSARTHAVWAGAIAEPLSPLLDAVREGEPDRAPRALPERRFAWSGGDQLVARARTGGSETLQQIAAEAEAEFGVDLAVVSLLDGTRLYYGLHTELLPTSIPAELSYCRLTVESDDVVLVPDAREDERFAGNPYLDVNHGWSYAGHPIHASTGEAIGSFCLHSTRPRKASAVSPERLREFALRAEAELQDYEVVPVAPQARSRRERRAAEQRAALEAAAAICATLRGLGQEDAPARLEPGGVVLPPTLGQGTPTASPPQR